MALIAMNRTIDDEEADHIVDEQPDIHGRGAGLPRRRERIVMLAVERDEDAAEVHAAGEDANRRHDDCRRPAT